MLLLFNDSLLIVVAWYIWPYLTKLTRNCALILDEFVLLCDGSDADPPKQQLQTHLPLNGEETEDMNQ